MFGKSSLEKSLNRWAKQGGKLDELLAEHTNQPVRSPSEAKAVCVALDALRHRREDDNSDTRSSLHQLTAFFQQVESDGAFEILAKDGLPQLRIWVRDLIDGKQGDHDAVMFIMKVLAMYQQKEDVDLIANAAQVPINADGFMWSRIFSQFGPAHSFANDMVDALRYPLPTSFILVSYLDMANALAIAGKLNLHPFDSDTGRNHLERWLSDKNEETFSYALSATAALPFIDQLARDQLLPIGYGHPDPLVRVEAAWAQARSGDSDGIVRLAQLCLDPCFSRTAQQYLEELGRDDEIPEMAKDPEFQAVAEMANWLAHPSEFGRPPDGIEVFDKLELFWPPTNDHRCLFLIKYSFDNVDGETEVGVGMVGSVTFALFGETTADLSPEDIYSLHCCWELEMNDDPRAPQVRTAAAGREVLARYNKL